MKTKTIRQRALKADLVRARLEKGLRDRAITPAFALEQAQAHGLVAYAKLVQALADFDKRRAKRAAIAVAAKVAESTNVVPMVAKVRVKASPLTDAEIAARRAAIEAVRKAA